jgi:hypothetical protein
VAQFRSGTADDGPIAFRRRRDACKTVKETLINALAPACNAELPHIFVAKRPNTTSIPAVFRLDMQQLGAAIGHNCINQRFLKQRKLFYS